MPVQENLNLRKKAPFCWTKSQKWIWGLQAKLLRVIQEKEVERLGSRKSLQLDVRIIATSNRDLKQAVSEGVFREDLFYRLNVFPLAWPALSQRVGDIIPISQHFITRYAQESNRVIPRLDAEAIARLETYPWPGNVRELENVIQRALILCPDDVLLPEHLILENNFETHIQSVQPQPELYGGNGLKQKRTDTDCRCIKRMPRQS